MSEHGSRRSEMKTTNFNFCYSVDPNLCAALCLDFSLYFGLVWFSLGCKSWSRHGIPVVETLDGLDNLSRRSDKTLDSLLNN